MAEENIQMKETPKAIPISKARTILERYNYDEVIIFAANYNTGIQHITTYGKTKQACENAGLGGDFIKKHLGWKDGISKYTTQYQERIAELERLTRQVPVGEELPPVHPQRDWVTISVLAFENGEWYRAWYDISGQMWVDDINGTPMYNVTHWQLLPFNPTQ